MTALAGTAMLAEGSTTTSGKYSRNIRLAVDYLLSMSRPNGLIGYREDYHYTYGHGFSMLFLSQVYGEEEDVQRREEIRGVLTSAVQFWPRMLRRLKVVGVMCQRRKAATSMKVRLV